MSTKKRHPVPVIKHPAYECALELAYTHINRAEPGTLVLIVGMSGAGKNTLLQELERRVLARNPLIEEGEMPIVKLVAVNANNAFYGSKDATSRLVDALADPFSATNKGELLAPFGIRSSYSTHRTVPEAALRRTGIRLLRARRTRFLFVDEADMMCVIKKGDRDPADHLESWRLLALESEIVVVLLATYRILTIWDRTSQFTRKMPTVHLRRYEESSESDIEDFVGILAQLCGIFGVSNKETARILSVGRSVMVATGGIFGQLLALFQRADDLAEADNRESFSLGDLRRSLPRKRQVTTLWSEITSGEARLEGSDFESVIDVARLAGSIVGGAAHSPVVRSSLECSKDDQASPAGQTATGRKKRVAKPKPRRAVRT